MRGLRGKRYIKMFILFFLLIFNLIYISTISADITKTNQSDEMIIVSRIGGDYSNIQNAINEAKEGSIIFIKKGIYTEVIDIDKKLTIIGENKYSTIINPISKDNKYAIKLEVSNITLKNLSITNGGSGLYTSGVRICSSNSRIYNCNFYDNPIGIAIFSNKNIIENCVFWNCKDEGIALIGTNISNCNFNKIMNCTFFNNCDGIELQYSSNNLIENCSIFNNTHTGIDAINKMNNGNIIRNCEINNNKVNGIYFSSSNDNKLISCNISNNKGGNIILSENSSNNILFEIKNNSSNYKINDDNSLLELNENNINDKFISLINTIFNFLPNLKQYFINYY